MENPIPLSLEEEITSLAKDVVRNLKHEDHTNTLKVHSLMEMTFNGAS